MRFNKFMSPLLASFIMASVVEAAELPKPVGPVIHYKYPPRMTLLPGVHEKYIDCGKILRFPADPKKMFLTCDFLEQVDQNGQNICDDTDPGRMPSTEPEQKAASGRATASGLYHFSKIHHICKQEAGLYQRKLAQKLRLVERQGLARQRNLPEPQQLGQQDIDAIEHNIKKMYGDDWEQPGMCPLSEVVKQCQQEMGYAQ